MMNPQEVIGPFVGRQPALILEVACLEKQKGIRPAVGDFGQSNPEAEETNPVQIHVVQERMSLGAANKNAAVDCVILEFIPRRDRLRGWAGKYLGHAGARDSIDGGLRRYLAGPIGWRGGKVAAGILPYLRSE